MNEASNYQLHNAETDTEKEAIYRFRFDVFGREMGLLGPVENWPEPKFTDPADEHSHHVYAELNSQIVGSIRITSGEYCATLEEYEQTYEFAPFLNVVEPKEIAVVTRLMVAKAYRGTPLAFALIKQIAEYCIGQGILCIFADCQPHLVPLYQRYGYRPYRSVFNDPYVGIMIPLVLVASDTDHLVRVRSPLARLLKKSQIDRTRTEKINRYIGQVSDIVTEELQGADTFRDTVNQHLPTHDDGDEDWGVLEGFTDEDIATLASGSYLMRCKQGDTIIHKNHATRTMFLVIEGLLECQLDGKAVAFVNKGDVVGEFAYLTNAPRTADIVVASEDASVLAFEKKHMIRLIDTHPKLAARCLLNLSRSLCIKFINHTYPEILIGKDD